MKLEVRNTPAECHSLFRPARYRGLVPCGIAPETTEHDVTSLAALGIAATMADVDGALRATFAEAFDQPPTCR